VTSGAVEIFFNDAAGAVKEYPGFADKAESAPAARCSSRSRESMRLHESARADGEDPDADRDAVLRMREFAIAESRRYVLLSRNVRRNAVRTSPLCVERNLPIGTYQDEAPAMVAVAH